MTAHVYQPQAPLPYVGEVVKTACREGEVEAARRHGCTTVAVRAWCAWFGVPSNPPPPSVESSLAGLVGILRQFTPKESP